MQVLGYMLLAPSWGGLPPWGWPGRPDFRYAGVTWYIAPLRNVCVLYLFWTEHYLIYETCNEIIPDFLSFLINNALTLAQPNWNYTFIWSGRSPSCIRMSPMSRITLKIANFSLGKAIMPSFIKTQIGLHRSWAHWIQDQGAHLTK